MNKTTQRETILYELRSSNSHQNAPELYEVWHKKLPQISLGPTYRNLEQLTERETRPKRTLYCYHKRFDAGASSYYLYCDTISNSKIYSPMESDKKFTQEPKKK